MIKSSGYKPANGGETTLRARFSGSENVERALRRAVNTEIAQLTQLTPFLATTGNTTPFIGLFGTVWGIMNSFHDIGQRGSASLAVVAPGISEALVATAAGLAAAIPAVIAFNYYTQRIRSIETELHSFSADFMNIVERDILVERRSLVMAFSNNNGNLMSEINVTPLVDVMLVLLIIFMVAAPMMTQGVDVDLPETTAAALPTESEHLIITINKENEIFINDFELGVGRCSEIS